MAKLHFQTDYQAILKHVDDIDPLRYGKTRNYIDGAVTYLSPYISRGVISTKFVLDRVLKKGYKISEMESFVKELCWRDYFQRVAQEKDVNVDIKQPQVKVTNHGIPSRILSAETGIEGIDAAIQGLYETGYMHNHCRMYTASVVCNIAGSHWQHPAQWMYFHLLDGDCASNACSWQWVAGANSNKAYYANQENINTYTHTQQQHTWLDKSYEELPSTDVPDELKETEHALLPLELPTSEKCEINPSLPTFIYTYYNLDPLWHRDEEGNRVLLIEPDFFAKYPVSKRCMDFMLNLSQNIEGIQLYVGSFQSFMDTYKCSTMYFKEHPLNVGYHGIQEERDWICDELRGYYPSFFAYWKKLEKHLTIEAK